MKPNQPKPSTRKLSSKLTKMIERLEKESHANNQLEKDIAVMYEAVEAFSARMKRQKRFLLAAGFIERPLDLTRAKKSGLFVHPETKKAFRMFFIGYISNRLVEAALRCVGNSAVPQVAQIFTDAIRSRLNP